MQDRLRQIALGLAREQAALEAINEDISVFNGPCVNCKWVSHSDYTLGGKDYLVCDNPSVSTIQHNALTGKLVRDSKKLWQVRSDVGLCGKEGVLYRFSLLSFMLRPLHAFGLLSFFIYFPASLFAGLGTSVAWHLIH